MNESADIFFLVMFGFLFAAGCDRRVGIGCAISYRIYWYDDEILAITCFVCHNLLRQRLLGVPFVKRLPFPNRNIPSKHSQTQRNVEGMSEQKAYTEIRFVYSINQRKLQFLKRCNSEGQNISYMQVNWMQSADSWFQRETDWIDKAYEWILHFSFAGFVVFV